LTLTVSCSTQEVKHEPKETVVETASTKASQDSIIDEHLKNGAWKKGLYSNEWQEEIDKGLAKDSTIAYLWQQKAMPLFKQGKYELGMPFLDKAVKYDRAEYQEYRAFMKCIFAKSYRDAIADFEDCKSKYGDSYVMDHSYSFYIALSKIQLNEYEEAERLLEADILAQKKERGEDLIHHLAYFYLGISKYEQKKYEEAIEVFDRAINLYPEFSDVIYYKAFCIGRLGNKEKARELIIQAESNGIKGFTINEDNSIYERYPYQVRW